MVTGAPGAPPPWAVNNVPFVGQVIVPQRWTVVPGPIWLAPVPQLLTELKNVYVRAFEQLDPLPAPVAF